MAHPFKIKDCFTAVKDKTKGRSLDPLKACFPRKGRKRTMLLRRWIGNVAAPLAAALLAACGPNAPATPDNPRGFAQAIRRAPAPLETPALVTFDTANEALAYWPITRKGVEATPQPLSGALGISSVYALAANGDTVVIANYAPAEIVTYDLDTQVETTMSDPYGNPTDVAVDKHGTIYALSAGNVAVYKLGSSHPTELTCSHVNEGEAIAVNNEGDVFVDGYGAGSFQGVVEYRHGSAGCSVPHLRKSRGYIAGVGVDPKSDDLIVVDDPDFCAGGLEGRMILYPKPYEQRTSARHILNATYCAGTLRLDASSTHIFYGDATVSAGYPIIDRARYPSGKSEGQYWEGYFGSGGFSGFTTIPNRLPN